MSIKSILNEKKFILSFEVIPPRNKESVPAFENKIQHLNKMSPDFISVTYGAAGRSKKGSLKAALYIKKKYGIEVLSHLTCINSTESEIEQYVNSLIDGGVNNVLALRGDIARGINKNQNLKYKYAKDLVKYLSKRQDICIAAATYPEGHSESESFEKDILYLKQKVECGVDFLITQFFFDNGYFYRFREKIEKLGINIPIIIGIMPVTKVRQLKNMSSLGGASLPNELIKIIDKYGDNEEDFFKAGLEYSLNQTRDLAKNAVDGVHIYTMNNLTAVDYIVNNL
ncbi:methylenetetrahydrofolate reductase [NAD(P)H] [Clostridium sp. cel8]|jgi:methylenetetrahydrofolate reductase (NADPH)|uniref:methylenetetrahydrofolate reductase [NAD(P)H] n=1 Tax=Clostridium sp. cel8 TaxID=2663123 RepID=UPI0015F46EC9|nr:methylenetetrahydrofolate reductase [NAD(P)H] [Clostridium sp. cel8]MBA5850121.1 methylenetetrahydrofolate reductase [NAD(P)H] [Clostridium sp. cel8]